MYGWLLFEKKMAFRVLCKWLVTNIKFPQQCLMYISQTKFPQNTVIIFLILSVWIYSRYKCDFAIMDSSFCACVTKNTQNLFQMQSPLYRHHSTEDNKSPNSLISAIIQSLLAPPPCFHVSTKFNYVCIPSALMCFILPLPNLPSL